MAAILAPTGELVVVVISRLYSTQSPTQMSSSELLTV